MSRVKMTIRNMLAGYGANILTMIIAFITRTIFIYRLGTGYLGINGLYTSILGVLSFAELGFGTAVNYSLYKPVAEGNKDLIKAYMRFYKKIYYVIAGVIAALGISLMPFLRVFVKGGENISDAELVLYYCIFLFNSVISYFTSYKYSLINAEQKNYITTGIDFAVTFVVNIMQIIVLLSTTNFALYLLCNSFVLVLRIFFVNYLVNKMYPYLADGNISNLPVGEVSVLKRNMKGLIFHKIADIGIHSTDNILISSLININVVGLVSNYNVLLNTCNGFISMIFTSTMSSIGNLIATTEGKYRFVVFKRLSALSKWIYGFVSVMLFLFLSPIITVWIGGDKTINSIAVALICINYYFQGQRVVYFNFKSGYGDWNDDKYIPIIAAIINLIVSYIACIKLGIIGIYIGTVISGLVQSTIRPIISYRKIFNENVKWYLVDLFLNALLYIIIAALLYIINTFVLAQLSLLTLLLSIICEAATVIILLILIFHRTEEFGYYLSLVKNLIRRKK